MSEETDRRDDMGDDRGVADSLSADQPIPTAENTARPAAPGAGESQGEKELHEELERRIVGAMVIFVADDVTNRRRAEARIHTGIGAMVQYQRPGAQGLDGGLSLQGKDAIGSVPSHFAIRIQDGERGHH